MTRTLPRLALGLMLTLAAADAPAQQNARTVTRIAPNHYVVERPGSRPDSVIQIGPGMWHRSPTPGAPGGSYTQQIGPGTWATSPSTAEPFIVPPSVVAPVAPAAPYR